MILGKHRTPVLLYVAVVVVLLSIGLSFVWARHFKARVPGVAPLHQKQ